MTSEEFFLPKPREELSQGDIVEFCPVGAVSAPLLVARPYRNNPPPERRGVFYDYPFTSKSKHPPSPDLFRGTSGSDAVVFDARLKRCIIISNDCVTIAKEENRSLSLDLSDKQRSYPWHVAPVEPWPAQSRTVAVAGGVRSLADLIEEGRIHRSLALPAFTNDKGQEVLPRSYADFKFLTPLKPDLFESMEVKRLASATDLGQAYLWGKVFTYFSGRPLPGRIPCPHCGAPFSLSDLAKSPETEESE